MNSVHVYRDLGFMVASDFTLKVHVDSIAKKANRSLGYIIFLNFLIFFYFLIFLIFQFFLIFYLIF